MYQVLYRKWRPKTFSDVVGQPQVTKTLKNELKLGRISHAYLFTGSRGTGKTTCAKILAKAVNCLNPQNGDPCGECEICKGIDNGSILDIVEIDAASNNGVDNIRLLREEAAFTPACAKYRVYIIDEVHMLSTGAFNALLKTLEEPPEHVVFILATTEIHKIPATILSRCQRFDFHRISSLDIAKRLEYVCENESKTIDEDASNLIAKLADGALRDALSLLDQCIGKADNITADIVKETAGLAGNEHIFSICDCIIENNCRNAIKLIAELYTASKDMERLLVEMLNHFRNIMLLKTTNGNDELIILSKDEYNKTLSQAKELSLEKTIHIIDTIQNSIGKMSLGADKRIEVEMCIIKLCSPELDDTNSALIDRIAKLERALRSGEFQEKNSEKCTAPATKEPIKDTAEILSEPKIQKTHESQHNIEKNTQISTTEKPADLSTLQENAVKMQNWPEVLKVLSSYSKAISTAFNGSTAYVNGNFVLIDAPNSMAFELLRKSAGRDKMRVAIKEVTGKTYKLGPYKKNEETNKTEDPLALLAKKAEDEGIHISKNI